MRVRFVLAAVGFLAIVVGCGSQSIYRPPATRDCLVQRGERFGGKLDFIAQTAIGGALIARLPDNEVTIVFGQSVSEGKQVELAYKRLAFQNVRGGLGDVLRRYGNAVTRWQEHPTALDLALLEGCLR